MDARDQGMLASLPTEILIKILLLLPTPGALLAATRSCKALYNLFHSHAVQYSFQLQTAHMQDWTVLDAAVVPAPASERLAILSERQQRWRTMQWKRFVPSLPPDFWAGRSRRVPRALTSLFVVGPLPCSRQAIVAQHGDGGTVYVRRSLSPELGAAPSH